MRQRLKTAVGRFWIVRRLVGVARGARSAAFFAGMDSDDVG